MPILEHFLFFFRDIFFLQTSGILIDFRTKRKFNAQSNLFNSTRNTNHMCVLQVIIQIRATNYPKNDLLLPTYYQALCGHSNNLRREKCCNINDTFKRVIGVLVNWHISTGFMWFYNIGIFTRIARATLVKIPC